MSKVSRYEVWLPFPPRELSPNYSPAAMIARIERTRAKAAYRYDCVEAIKKAKIPKVKGKCILHLSWYFARERDSPYRPKYYPRDDDNAIASFKSGRDAFKIAGVIDDDDAKHLRIGVVTLNCKYTHPGHANTHSRILATLEVIEDDDQCEGDRSQ